MSHQQRIRLPLIPALAGGAAAHVRRVKMQRERDDREERELKREQKKAAKKAALVQTAANSGAS